MASFKESSISRPFPQSGLPVRQSNARNHSHAHSISLGAVNTNHRVTRRKSIASAAAANAAAAVAATMKDSGDPVTIPMASHRRSLAGRKGLESSSLGATSALSSSLSRSVNAGSDRKTSPNAIDENSAAEGSASGTKPVSTKSRNRRASEGSNLNRGEGKRVASELRCERCGKGYKHSSCLTKHMWEHDPAWQFTSKLLISKHQQVQLLEAATVLVNMNQEPTTEMESEDSSASPATSSELRDGLSSTETTPPPMDEDGPELPESDTPAGYGKRYSVASTSAFSRSYQSSSFADSAPLHSPAFSHFRHSSIDTRPSTADTGSSDDDDEADLAAAIGLCNFGTPRTGPVPMSPDVPPVPPLPARFLGQNIHSNPLSQSAAAAMPLPSSASTIYGSFSLNPSLSYKVSDERDVKMEDVHRESRQRRNADVDFGSRHHGEDDDDGVFGLMEE
ncbi:hypothetical protein DTO027B5_3987 [Paecilomyces variotii]|nr:hypothetical protein DTO169C6_8442 [Paecilomyces variotii]KAJ9265932.1 hypothetical protein DTO195F2_1534 [Paecilomyces variotii]KAJ9291805.1 hypothetical protein DTO021C3_706 [Paecilomyces variotii]KAJ9321196.1 hypothetical protein DTO027B3_7768 [Paecilomyces variotii]KAJ9334279.1 hypothetical protein DTO027B5_3987 [Paecilomyces variotii]